MRRDFHSLDEGSPADGALPVIVGCISCQADQVRVWYNQLLATNAVVQVNTARLRRLDRDHDQTRHHTESLQKELDAALVEVRTLRKNHATLERRLTEA